MATPEENRALVRRFLTDVVAGRDHDALDAFVDDVIEDDLVFGIGHGRETVLGRKRTTLALVGDVDLAIEDVVADGDSVAVRATVTGTHRGSLLNLVPIRGSFDIAYVWFFGVEDGKIAEMWALPDVLSLVQQLDDTPRNGDR